MSNIKIYSESVQEYITNTGVDTFKNYFVSRYHQLKRIFSEKFKLLNVSPIEIKNIKNIKQDQCYIVARVYEISETEKYMCFLLDDISGFIECRYYKKENENIKIITDIILGFKLYRGKTIKQIIFPDIPYSSLKILNKNIKKFAVLISDIHVGSKLFQESKFMNFITYINTLKQVKYIILGGDIVDGIGVYPDQEKDLKLIDIDEQYKQLAVYLQSLRKDIKIIISPGNHDYLPVEEPQDKLQPRFTKLFDTSRTLFIPNPCLFDLEGVLYLMYHGRGMDSLLATGKFSTHEQQVEELSEFLLKVRHLSPSYDAKNTNFILNKDLLVVTKKPDLLHLGHIHRGFIKNYKGTLICNAGTWQNQTDFQKRMDLFPDIGIFILVNLNDLSQCFIKKI